MAGDSSVGWRERNSVMRVGKAAASILEEAEVEEGVEVIEEVVEEEVEVVVPAPGHHVLPCPGVHYRDVPGQVQVQERRWR